MLGIQLEALSAAEVRRLLDLARARGQHGLARQLEAELAARPGRTPGQPLAMSSTPMSAPRRRAPPPARQRGPAIAVAGLAAFIGGAVAWGLSLAPPPAPRQQVIAVANTEPPPRIAVALTSAALPEESVNQPFREPAAPALVARLPGEPTRARPQRAQADNNPCLDLPTAHERLVCGYPSLAIQDQRMKAALDRARANGSDVKAIEDAQAEWQEGSLNVQDRLALADRYDQRIAELESE